MSENIYKNILVMTDFSEDSKYAVSVAARLALQGGSELTILHVAHDESQISLYINESDVKRIKEQIDREVQAEMDRLKEEIPELKELRARHIIRRGIPYVEGLLEIEKGGYDLVVLGSHGRTSIKKFFFGSTVAKVARRAPVSVLITRKPH